MEQLVIGFLSMFGSLALALMGLNVLSLNLGSMTGPRIAEGLRLAFRKLTPWRIYRDTMANSLVSQNCIKTYASILGYSNSKMINQSQTVTALRGALVGENLIVWFVALTITSPILTSVSLPLAGIGLVIWLLFYYNQDLRHSSNIFISIAVIFMGLAMAKTAVRDLVFSNILEASEIIIYTTNASYFSMILGVLVGIVLATLFRNAAMTAFTALVLSVTITGNLFAVGMAIGAPLGIMFILAKIADKTGTTTRRAVVIHSLVMIVSAALTLFVAMFAVDYIQRGNSYLLTASAFTLCTLVFPHLAAFIVRPCVKIVNIMIPHKSDGKQKLIMLSSTFRPDPVLSLVEAENEIINHARRTYKMMTLVKEMVTETDKQKIDALFGRIQKYDMITKRVENEILDYICQVQGFGNNNVSRHRIKFAILRIGRIKEIALNIIKLSQVLKMVKDHERQLTQRQLTVIENAVANIQKLQYSVVDTLERQSNQQEIPADQNQMFQALIDSVKENEKMYYPYFQFEMIDMVTFMVTICNALSLLANPDELNQTHKQ